MLKVLATTFDGLRDVARFRAEAAALKETKEFRAAILEEERQIAEEQTRARGVVARGGGLMDEATHDAALAAIRKLLATWREQSKAADDSAARRVARRTLTHVYAETLESALYLYEPQKNFKVAVANLELAAEVFPAVARTEYELARVLALDGRKDKALDALARAVEKGSRDAAEAEREEAFAPLRSNSRFKKLLAGMAEAPPAGGATTREKN
jgi:tetratricopeptide (TPR) repeat protein